MDREQAAKLAHDAGITFVTECGVASATEEWIERFAALVAAATKKEDAKICADHARESWDHEGGAMWCHDAIENSTKEIE